MQLNSEQQQIVEKYRVDAVNIAVKVAKRMTDDIRSAAHVGLCEAAVTYNPAKSMWRSWMYTCVRREVVRDFRRNVLRETAPLPPDVATMDTNMVDIDDLLEILPDRNREIFRDYTLHSVSAKRLSLQHNVSTQRVYGVLAWCRERLRRELDCEIRLSNSCKRAKTCTRRRKSSPDRTAVTLPA